MYTRRRTFKHSLIIIAVSFAPFLLCVIALRIRVLLHLAAYGLFLLMIVISIFLGAVFYNFSRNVDEHGQSIDWLALAAAIIFGIGILITLRFIPSHEMARAFNYNDYRANDD